MTPTKASECTDFFTFHSSSEGRNIRICKICPSDCPHCFCENMIKHEECPHGIKEMT